MNGIHLSVIQTDGTLLLVLVSNGMEYVVVVRGSVVVCCMAVHGIESLDRRIYHLKYSCRTRCMCIEVCFIITDGLFILYIIYIYIYMLYHSSMSV